MSDEKGIAIVSGASSGMGRDFVYALHKRALYSEIWIIARREERLEEIRKDLDLSIVVLALDLTKDEDLKVIEEKLKEERKSVKTLVNAAGCGIFSSFIESDRKSLDNIILLNNKALVDLTSIVLPYMEKGSEIVNLCSNSSWQPVPYMAVYASSKAFALSFSYSLSAELKKKGIFVMAVCPGWIKTEFFDHAVKDNTTIVYYDKFYSSKSVVDKALKDLERRKSVSILGLRVRMQVRTVKLLPKKLVMAIWLKQQKK